MTDIPTYLRAAADEPPPTGIDLDKIISADQRRSTRLRAAGAIGGTAAAVVAVLLGATLLPGGQPHRADLGGPATPAVSAPTSRSAGRTTSSHPEPSASAPSEGALPCDIVIRVPQGVYQSYTAVRPDPTEPAGDAGRRLSQSLLGALDRMLPVGVTMRDTLHADGCGAPLFVFKPERRTFDFSVVLTDPAGRSGFGVTVLAAPTELEPCHNWGDSRNCRVVQLPDGAVAGVSTTELTFPGGPGQGTATGARSVAVMVIRKDGTAVIASADNAADGVRRQATRPDPTFTTDQLMNLLTLADLTLYP